MERAKVVLAYAGAVLLGIIIGAYFVHPPIVRAIGSQYFINVQKVREGNNSKSPLSGSQIIGFSCTSQDCYVATTE